MKNTLSSKLIPLFWAWMVVGSLCLLALLIPVFTHQRAQFDIKNWVGLLFQGVYVTLTFYLVQLTYFLFEKASLATQQAERFHLSATSPFLDCDLILEGITRGSIVDKPDILPNTYYNVSVTARSVRVTNIGLGPAYSIKVALSMATLSGSATGIKIPVLINDTVVRMEHLGLGAKDTAEISLPSYVPMLPTAAIVRSEAHGPALPGLYVSISYRNLYGGAASLDKFFPIIWDEDKHACVQEQNFTIATNTADVEATTNDTSIHFYSERAIWSASFTRACAVYEKENGETVKFIPFE